jgi:hypothetical protein
LRTTPRIEPGGTAAGVVSTVLCSTVLVSRVLFVELVQQPVTAVAPAKMRGTPESCGGREERAAYHGCE